MKLFAMDDYEYWIGPDAETCKAAYLKEYGDDEFTQDIGPTMLSAESLEAMKVDMSEDADGSGPIITGAEFLRLEIEKGGDFPRYAFAHES